MLAVGRDRQRLVTLAEDANNESLDIAEHCDITSEEQVRALIGQLEPIHVLVNNAGMSATDPVRRVELAGCVNGQGLVLDGGGIQG